MDANTRQFETELAAQETERNLQLELHPETDVTVATML